MVQLLLTEPIRELSLTNSSALCNGSFYSSSGSFDASLGPEYSAKPEADESILLSLERLSYELKSIDDGSELL